MSSSVVIVEEWVTDCGAHPLIQSFNLTAPPVRLVRTPAHRGRAGFITVSLVLAQFSPHSISPCLSILRYLAGMLQKWVGCSVLYIVPWPQFVIFHTRWSLLWNEMSFPKMKRHKSSVINLLVRLLQLSPVEDIWTADWLMPAVGLKQSSLSSITYPTVSLSAGF